MSRIPEAKRPVFYYIFAAISIKRLSDLRFSWKSFQTSLMEKKIILSIVALKVKLKLRNYNGSI